MYSALLALRTPFRLHDMIEEQDQVECSLIHSLVCRKRRSVDFLSKELICARVLKSIFGHKRSSVTAMDGEIVCVRIRNAAVSDSQCNLSASKVIMTL